MNKEILFGKLGCDELGLDKLLVEKLICKFRHIHQSEPFNGMEELPKWELLNEASGSSNVELVRSILPYKFLYDSARLSKVLPFLCENSPKELDVCLQNLFDETVNLEDRLKLFKKEMREICPIEYEVCPNDERMAALLLACQYPYKYTIYVYDKLYKPLCSFFHIEKQKAGKRYEHYMALLHAICKEYGSDIQKIISTEIESFSIKPEILAVQTFLWVIKGYLTDDFKDEFYPKMNYKNYIDLLVANHNVILNGAPGTGKTYLAKKIAEAMGADVKMVQFHPSFDYSDFVEGLRPVKDELGNISFERKNGIFKEFCRVALQNLKDSKKDVKILQKERDVSEILDEYIAEKIETGEEMQTASRKNKFVLIDQDEKNIKVNIPDNPIVKDVLVPKSDVLSILLDDKAKIDNVKSIREYFGRNYNTQADSYAFVIFNDLKSRKVKTSTVQVEAVNAKDFVFIIDEINRGEISKIFGELFFSIDPGYRGEKGKVQTQYQNLVEDGDVFKDGFFVPENVYIIGTMNDIDRSVESMDFAMRRRFAWHEVTAEESAKNMGLNEELAMRMNSLNQVISDTEGLGSAYHVGGSFFLKVQKGEMTVDSLWNLNLKSLLKEYLRGLPDADETLEKMENAYFLKEQKTVSDIDE